MHGFRIRILVAISWASLMVASLVGCSANPAPGGDFCSVFVAVKSKITSADTWVDSKGNVNCTKVALGIDQLFDTVTKLDTLAPPEVKQDLDQITPIIAQVKDAVISGDQAQIVASIKQLTSPSTRQVLDNALDSAVAACSA